MLPGNTKRALSWTFFCHYWRHQAGAPFGIFIEEKPVVADGSRLRIVGGLCDV